MPAISPSGVFLPGMSMTSAASMTSLSLRIEQASRNFSLPDGARRVISSWDSKGQSNDHLVDWLAADRELCQRLLRWCNTPLYNLSEPFSSLQEACGVMDPRELTRLAVLACVRGLFLPDLGIDQYRREALWNHSIAVGMVASMISRVSGCGDPSSVLVAGTLHDIGLCASERLAPEAFAAVIALVDELSPIHEVERELLGWDHTELGEAVLRQWGMPASIAWVARHHHQAELELSGPHGAELACVSVANYLCSRAGWTAAGRHYLPAPNQRVFAHLGIDASLLTVLWQQLSVPLESVTAFV